MVVALLVWEGRENNMDVVLLVLDMKFKNKMFHLRDEVVGHGTRVRKRLLLGWGMLNIVGYL